MRISRVTATASLAATTLAQSNNTCVNGAYIIVARESGAPPGFGYLGTVKDEIIAQIPDSTGVAVAYPATITGPVLYFESVPDGSGNMTELVKSYGDACPGHKMVLMGYSQGAQVVGDVLLGNINPVFGNSTAIDTKYVDSVAAVVLMGDPANVANQSFSVGNSTHNGIFVRKNPELWSEKGLTDRTVAYCDAGDTYCDSGPPGDYGHIVHNGYIAEYGSDAVKFVVEKFSAAANSSSTTSTTSPGSTSATPAPSSTTGTNPAGTTTGPASATSTTSRPNSAVAVRSSSRHILAAGAAAYAFTWAML